MEIQFKKAERKDGKLRLSLIAPSGYGKTHSALLIAKGLGGKIAVLDTENASASLEAGKDGIPEFDTLNMSAPYMPEKYVLAIKAAEEAGYDTIIIDSLTHAWAGSGGLLDKHGAIADKGGNSFAAWRTVTPDHTKLVDAIIGSKIHVISTMRSKTEYSLEGGKVTKVGLAPVQREGMEYEMTLVFDLDKTHNGHCSKDRTGLFDGKITKMSADVGKQLKAWLNSSSKAAVEAQKKYEAEEALKTPEQKIKELEDALENS